MKLLWLVALLGFVSANQNINVIERIDHFLELNPHLAWNLQGHIYSPGASRYMDAEALQPFSDGQLKSLRKMFPYPPLYEDNEVGAMLQGEPLPDVNLLQDLNVQTIAEILIQDGEKREILVSGLQSEYVSQRDILEDEECKKDVEAFMNPIIGTLLKILCHAICDWENTPILCGQLCNIIIDPDPIPAWSLRCESIKLPLYFPIMAHITYLTAYEWQTIVTCLHLVVVCWWFTGQLGKLMDAYLYIYKRSFSWIECSLPMDEIDESHWF